MASLTEEVYKEERLTGPVEYYVDAYKRPSILFDKNTKNKNQESYNKYLDDYIRIYRKKRGNISVAEITKNFNKNIKLERQRRHDETEAVRAVQKDERTDERILHNKMKYVLEKKTYGPIGQLKDSAQAMKDPPSSMNLKMYKRNQAKKRAAHYKKKWKKKLKKVGPLPRQLVEKIGPSQLSSGASKTTETGGGRKKRKKRKRRTKKKRRRKRRKSKSKELPTRALTDKRINGLVEQRRGRFGEMLDPSKARGPILTGEPRNLAEAYHHEFFQSKLDEGLGRLIADEDAWYTRRLIADEDNWYTTPLRSTGQLKEDNKSKGGKRRKTRKRKKRRRTKKKRRKNKRKSKKNKRKSRKRRR